MLSTGNLSLAAGATLLVEITGATPGTGYDQVHVAGSVNLAGATLSLSGVGSNRAPARLHHHCQ